MLCAVCGAPAAVAPGVYDDVRCTAHACGYQWAQPAETPWREGLDWYPGVPTYATDSIFYKFVRSFRSTAQHRKRGSF